MRENSLIKQFDWLTLLMYLAIVTIGCLNIYAADYNVLDEVSFFNLDTHSGKQVLFLGIAGLLTILILLIDFKLYFSLGYLAYGLAILFLLLPFLWKATNGAQAWIPLGPIKIMPAEFVKVAIALGLAKYIDESPHFKIGMNKDTSSLLGLILFPSIIVLLQNETGTVLVFFSLMFMFYREGLSFIIPLLGLVVITLFAVSVSYAFYGKGLLPVYLSITGLAIALGYFVRKNKSVMGLLFGAWLFCVGVVTGSSFVYNNVLQKHQQNRVATLFDPYKDKLGAGWQVIRALTGISSGGTQGKGFLEGDITQGDFVPEQHTDMIFTTIAEEQGFWKTSAFILLYGGFLIRLLFLAERQRSIFSRVFGYSLTSFLFFHFMINIGMTMNLFPVIGIPLPFVSYGGSSMLAFSIMLFIFLKLDMHRSQVLAR